MRSGSGRATTLALFVIYVVVLVGTVLFKFPFSYQVAGTGRVVNLVPLKGSFTEHGTLRVGEVVANVLIFVPLGIYIAMLKGRWSFVGRILPVIGTSVTFETLQYIFAIGVTDITDVLTNTLGGATGIGIHTALTKLLRRRTNGVVNIAAAALTTGALLFFAFLFTRRGATLAGG